MESWFHLLIGSFPQDRLRHFPGKYSIKTFCPKNTALKLCFSKSKCNSLLIIIIKLKMHYLVNNLTLIWKEWTKPFQQIEIFLKTFFKYCKLPGDIFWCPTVYMSKGDTTMSVWLKHGHKTGECCSSHHLSAQHSTGQHKKLSNRVLTESSRLHFYFPAFFSFSP